MWAWPIRRSSRTSAAGNGGRVVVTFVNKPVAGLGNLRAALAPNSASGFTVGSPDATTDTLVSDSDVAMDPVSGVAYTVFTAANMGGDVHAARLSGSTWTAIAPVLDDVQADDAGGTGRDTGARVAVDSSGNAVAAWPEKDAGMHAHVFVRRITGTTPATGDAEASIATLDGHADAQASADHVDMDGGNTANPWVVFRQMFVYGGANRPRALARQLVGNTLSTTQVLDGLPADNPTEGAEFPRIDVNAAGKGLVGSPRQLSFQAFGSSLSGGTWTPGFRLDAGTPTGSPVPVPAIADNGNGLFSWIDTTGGAAATGVVAREDIGGTLGAQQTLSLATAGPVVIGGIGAASSAAGNVAVGFAQGNGGAADPRSIVAAVVDLPNGWWGWRRRGRRRQRQDAAHGLFAAPQPHHLRPGVGAAAPQPAHAGGHHDQLQGQRGVQDHAHLRARAPGPARGQALPEADQGAQPQAPLLALRERQAQPRLHHGRRHPQGQLPGSPQPPQEA